MEIQKIEAVTREEFPALADAKLGFDAVKKGGSGRQFFRIYQDEKPSGLFIMQFQLDRSDNAHFAPITDFLVAQGFPVPIIRGRREDLGLLWMDDLGMTDLGILADEKWDSIRRPAYEAALRTVFRLHQMRESNPPEGLPALEPGFDETLYQWEQDYFFDFFAANFCAAEALKHRGDPSFVALRKELAQQPRSLIHRDFQSSNIMLLNGNCSLVDYQGMRWGLPEYDLASLIYDPYVSMSDARREHLADFYFKLKRDSGDNESYPAFRKRLHLCAAQRLMQALGAYGNLGLNQGKKEFLQSIPAAIKRLRDVAAKGGELAILEQLLNPQDAGNRLAQLNEDRMKP